MKLVNLTCPNCGAPLEKIGDNLCCNACGGAFAIDYDDADVEHEKLLTEDERAAREFEHEKELMQIKHQQEEEARIAAEKREHSRQFKQKVGRTVSNKIKGLITLAIIVLFFFGCYKLGVHWGITPKISDIVESAKVTQKDPYSVEVGDISSELIEELVASAETTMKSKKDMVIDLVDDEWVDYKIGSIEYDSIYFIKNPEDSKNNVVVIFKLTYNSDIGDKVTYDAVCFSDLKFDSEDKVICDFDGDLMYKGSSAWHGDSYEDRDQCYRESVSGKGGSATELKREA